MVYDFSQPYRTEKIYQLVKDKALSTPLCIPSYSRPDAPMFKGKIGQMLRPDFVYVFIRKGQHNLYEKHKDKVTLVELPEDVQEIGLTRESILQWAIRQGYDNMFMTDDRVLSLSTLVPALTGNGKLVMKSAQWSDLYTTLKVWEYLHTNMYPNTISYAIFHENSWYPHNIGAAPRMRGWTEAMCVNLNDVKRYDLHFPDSRIYGKEDHYFLWSIRKLGLVHYSFTDIAYKEIHPSKMSQDTGAGANFGGTVPRDDRIRSMLKLFMEKAVGVPWEEKAPGFRYDYDKRTGLVSDIRFDWKFWDKYYDEHRKDGSNGV